jgi:hypothetical protein
MKTNSLPAWLLKTGKALWLASVLIPAFPLAATASPRAAAAVAEAALPIASKEAMREAAEQSANAAVRQSVSVAVAEAAAKRSLAEVAVAARSATTSAAVGEVVIIEQKAPGMGARVMEMFGERSTQLGAKQIPASEIPLLVGIAEKAPDAAARARLLEGYLKAAETPAARQSWWKEILAVGGAGGLYSSMSKTGEGISDGIISVGQGFGEAARKATESIPLIIAASAVAGLVLLFLISRLIPRREPAHGASHCERIQVRKNGRKN